MHRVGVLALCCVACGGGSGGAVGAPDASAPRIDAPAVGSDPYPAWGVMDTYLGDQLQGGVLHGDAIQIFDGSDHLIYQSSAGACVTPDECPEGAPAYTPDLVTGVASSTKWVTSTTALAAFEEQVAAGRFASLDAALDTPISHALVCGGALPASVGAITPRQLMAFTDGLLPEHACVGVATYQGAVQTLETCACHILLDSAAVMQTSATAGDPATTAQPPGTTYKYGDAHHTVLGAVIERMEGEPWAMTFQRLVASKIGVAWAYGPPSSTVNPNLAGSIRASVADYAKFVRGVFHAQLISPAAVAEQEAPQAGAGVVVRIDPLPGLQYGLNNWRYCYDLPQGEDFLMFVAPPPVRTACDQAFAVGHAGKGGFDPWIDRQSGFYGVFAMREASPGGNASYTPAEMVVTANVRLLAQLIVDGQLAIAP